MRNLALFVTPDQSSAGDALLSQVFGEEQNGSFSVSLSETGSLPATWMGAYARGLTDDQCALIADQDTVRWFETTWPDALTQLGVLIADQDED